MKQRASCSRRGRITQVCREAAGQLPQEPGDVPAGRAGCTAGARARAGKQGAAGRAEWEHPTQDPGTRWALRGAAEVGCRGRWTTSACCVPVTQKELGATGAAPWVGSCAWMLPRGGGTAHRSDEETRDLERRGGSGISQVRHTGRRAAASC